MSYRHPLEIQKPPEGRDSRGRRDDAPWEKVFGPVNGKITKLSGTELVRARQIVGSATHLIELRVIRIIDLTTKHRFKFRGRYFDIGDIEDVEERRMTWICTCTEVRP